MRSIHLLALLAAAPASISCGQTDDWRTAEAGILEHHVQLTSADRFLRAGESYFSPDDARVIFQAEETPPEGEAADGFYGMYVADVVRGEDGRITGLEWIRRISPPGSANTCGWFHPTEPGVVIFASTIGPPTEGSPPGYQRATGRYRWMFPPEMQIVRCDLEEATGRAESLQPLLEHAGSYMAEGSLTRDGRHLLYCSLESNQGDLFMRDLERNVTTRIVGAFGYDGGPFFSPEQRRICYRSDRRQDHHLQLFVADLVFDRHGTAQGIEREYQLTDNAAVNWCPFWHPDGRHLVYATSEVGHHNYEVFVIDADPGSLPGSKGTVRYGTRKRRLTHAAGADVLPAFTHDGCTMIWTSKRGPSGTSQLWVADLVLDLDASPVPPPAEEPGRRSPHEEH